MATLPTGGCCTDDCSCACTETTYVQVAGPAGADGAAGAAGAAGSDGESAWTETTNDFVVPVVGGTVDVFVDSTAFMFAGMILQIEGAGGYSVDTVLTGTTVRIENLGWAINAAPAVNISTGAMVVPSGPEGPTGVGSYAPVDAKYWVSEANGTLSTEINIGALAGGSGYLYSTVAAGVSTPSTVDTIPLADIDTSAVAAPTGKVLKPGALVATAGKVEDDEIDYSSVALTPGANVDIDWSLGRVFTMTLTVNTTFTFSNLDSAKSIMLILTQDAAAAKTVDFPAATYWPGGTEIEISTTLSCKAVYSFVYDGTHVIGTCVNDCQ